MVIIQIYSLILFSHSNTLQFDIIDANSRTFVAYGFILNIRHKCRSETIPNGKITTSASSSYQLLVDVVAEPRLSCVVNVQSIDYTTF